MKAKQNLEQIQEFETLIISSPNCNDTLVMSLTDKLHFCMYRDTRPSLARDKVAHLSAYSAIERPVIFTDKLFVIANDENTNTSTLFCVAETKYGLQINEVKSKHLEQKQDLTR